EAIGDVAVPLKGASSDIMGRARSVWKVNEQGELEALNADGTAVYETDGTTALQMSTFAQDMIKSAPFLFEKSSGGGGGGGHKRPNGGDDVKTLASSDQKAIGKNLEKIASGEIEVVD
ncbi:hypothetical protein KAR91_14170, partial [Candidatus Pacearchaeota archaeon]|nr:hypothetical protein [Candidatus Pacearchaeota archaeon]